MAKETIGDMYVAIRGDVSTLRRDMANLQKQVEGDARKIENSFSGTFKRIAKNTAAFLGITSALTIVNRLLTNMVKKFREFDREMQNVNTIIGVSATRLNLMKDAVRGLSREIGGNAKDLAEGLYQATSAGVKAGDAMKFLRTAAIAAKAGLSSTKVSVDGLTTVVNAWHMSANDANKVADIMFETVKRGKTTFEELATSMATVAGIAASSGVSFENVSGAIATLTKQGVPTAQAATQIRAAIIAMNEELGDGWSRSMTMAEAMEEMRRRTGYSNTALKEMVGRVEGVNGILGMTAKNAQMASEDFEAMGASGGSMMKAFAEQTKSLDFVMNRLGSTFDDALLRTMNALIPVFNTVQSAVQGFIDFVMPVEDALERERVAMISAASAAMDYAEGTKERKVALTKLKDEYPDLMKNLNVEKTTNEELVTALKEVNAQYIARAKAMAIEKQLAEIYGDVSEAADTYAKAEADLRAAYEARAGQGSSIGKNAEELRKEYEKLYQASVVLSNEGALTYQQFAKVDEVMVGFDRSLESMNQTATESDNRIKILQEQLRQLGDVLATVDTNADGALGGLAGGPVATEFEVKGKVKPKISGEGDYEKRLQNELMKPLSPEEIDEKFKKGREEVEKAYTGIGEAAIQGLAASGISTIWQELTAGVRKEAGVITRIFMGMVDSIMAELTRLTATKILSLATSGGFLSFLNLQHGGTVHGGLKQVKKFAAGGSMDVPFGFQNDQYPVRVESGERLDVTTRGKASAQESMLQNLNDRIEALNRNLLDMGGSSKGTDVSVNVTGEIRGNDIRLAYDKNNNIIKRVR